MSTSASRAAPSSPNPPAQDSPRTRDWSNPRTGEQDSAFRGISRGRGRGRGGGIRGGRGSGTKLGPKGGSHPDTADSTPSLSPTAPPVLRKLPIPTSTPTSSGSSEKAVNGSAERGGRPKSTSRKQSRAPPAVVISVTPPPKNSQTGPPTPSRPTNRRHRPPQGKTPTTTTKPPLPSAVKVQNPRAGSTQTILRKDVPPHLAAAHEAEIRHDVDVLVERVRAVAMAEHRPTTPGSHIDWAGDEDDSLPDLDDWGVTTTRTNPAHDEDQCEEISPILEDSLKTLPEPNSEAQDDQEFQGSDVEASQLQESSIKPSFLPSPTNGTTIAPAEKSPNQCIIAPTAVEEQSSPTLSDGKLPLHPSLPPKPVAAMECLRARGRSVSKPSDLPPKPSVLDTEDETTTKTEGLAVSIHAPSADERHAMERVSSACLSERGLAASIHAPIPGLPESHSAPSLLSTRPTSSTPRSHSRSKTEGRTGIQQSDSGPASTISHRGRSGATSPLGKHVYTHARNHSTPAMGAGSRSPQTSRPIITGEAISKLARTIGGHGPAPRTQTIPVSKDSTVS